MKSCMRAGNRCDPAACMPKKAFSEQAPCQKKTALRRSKIARQCSHLTFIHIHNIGCSIEGPEHLGHWAVWRSSCHCPTSPLALRATCLSNKIQKPRGLGVVLVQFLDHALTHSAMRTFEHYSNLLRGRKTETHPCREGPRGSRVVALAQIAEVRADSFRAWNRASANTPQPQKQRCSTFVFA